jgi:hypothetical protein
MERVKMPIWLLAVFVAGLVRYHPSAAPPVKQ